MKFQIALDLCQFFVSDEQVAWFCCHEANLSVPKG
jgi:hypothetical protein